MKPIELEVGPVDRRYYGFWSSRDKLLDVVEGRAVMALYDSELPLIYMSTGEVLAEDMLVGKDPALGEVRATLHSTSVLMMIHEMTLRKKRTLKRTKNLF